MNKIVLVALALIVPVAAVAQDAAPTPAPDVVTPAPAPAPTPRRSTMPQIPAPDHKYSREELQSAPYEDLQKFLASRGIGRRLLSQKGGFPIEWARDMALAEWDRNPE